MTDICGGLALSIFDSISKNFSSFLFTIDYMPIDLLVYPSTHQLLFFGTYQSTLVRYVKVYEDRIQYISNCDSSSLDLTLVGSSEYVPVLFNYTTTGTIYDTTSYFAISTNIDVVENSATVTESDPAINTVDANIEIVPNTNADVELDLTCSLAGNVAVTHTFDDYDGGLVPNWVSLDDTTGTLSISSPDVSSLTTFTFAVLSLIDNNPSEIYKPIHIKVIPCGEN